MDLDLSLSCEVEMRKENIQKLNFGDENENLAWSQFADGVETDLKTNVSHLKLQT